MEYKQEILNIVFTSLHDVFCTRDVDDVRDVHDAGGTDGEHVSDGGCVARGILSARGSHVQAHGGHMWHHDARTQVRGQGGDAHSVAGDDAQRPVCDVHILGDDVHIEDAHVVHDVRRQDLLVHDVQRRDHNDQRVRKLVHDAPPLYCLCSERRNCSTTFL